jgi:hypothetical protein
VLDLFVLIREAGNMLGPPTEQSRRFVHLVTPEYFGLADECCFLGFQVFNLFTDLLLFCF